MNKLEEITGMTMKELTLLNHLKLYQKNLTEIPPEIGQLTALTKLDLSGNRISVIP
ncbi:Leucine rich repeat-containing protein, partial [Sarcina sp. DSM 11001]